MSVVVQALQESGEFIVLNAGAYHSGYNQVRMRGSNTMFAHASVGCRRGCWLQPDKTPLVGPFR